MSRDVLISILDSGEIERYAIYSRYLNVSDPITVKVQNFCLCIVKSAYKLNLSLNSAKEVDRQSVSKHTRKSTSLTILTRFRQLFLEC